MLAGHRGGGGGLGGSLLPSLTLFCLLPRVAPRPRRGHRRSPASGFPGDRRRGSPKRSGDRPALSHRPAASPGQQRCHRSPHGETPLREGSRQTLGLWGPNCGKRGPSAPRPWQGPVLDASLCNLGEPGADATKEIRGVGPSLPSGARLPQSSFSWELPPCGFPPPLFFSSLLPRAPFP